MAVLGYFCPYHAFEMWNNNENQQKSNSLPLAEYLMPCSGILTILGTIWHLHATPIDFSTNAGFPQFFSGSR